MANFYMVPGGAGLMDGTSWGNAFDWAAFDNWLTLLANAGDFLYVLTGTYVGSSDVITARDGLMASRISIIGVSSQAATPAEAHGTDRPLFAMAAGFVLTVDNYWKVRNLRTVGNDASPLLRADQYSHIENCDCENAGVGAGIGSWSNYGVVQNCRAKSVGGNAFEMQAGAYSEKAFIGNVAYESAAGIEITAGNYNLVAGNLIYNCTAGIILGTGTNSQVIGNTIYGCTDGIAAVAPTNRCKFHNNILSGNTVPANWSGGAAPSDVWDWNCWHNSATPVAVTPGPNAVYEDPGFVDPVTFDFRVRNEAVRNLGATLFTIGGITPSIYEEGETGIGAPAATMDFSGDQLLIDGLESVELDGSDLHNVYPLQELVDEQEPSEGVYLSRNVEFHLPVGTALYPGTSVPSVGGTIIDSAGTSYMILAVRPPYIPDQTEPDSGDYWGCQTRAFDIVGTYDLDDLVTLYPGVDTLTEMGSRTIDHSTADASFTDVPAKIALQPSVTALEAGQRDFIQMCNVYVDGEIGQVHNGDLLKDQSDHWYTIVSYRSRQRIDELSVILCEDRIAGV